MEEAEIATGCRRGEAKAQRALYDSYAPRLMATIVRYVGRGDVAQDCHSSAVSSSSKIVCAARCLMIKWKKML